MKKKILIRSLLGFPIGVFIANSLSLIISAVSGSFLPTSPSLVASMGGALPAAVIQFFLSGLLGAVVAGLSAVWDMENWSITKRTLIHFLGMVLAYIPTSYLLHWMPPNSYGVLLFFGIFVIIYFSIWLGQYLYWRQSLRAVNQSLPK